MVALRWGSVCWDDASLPFNVYIMRVLPSLYQTANLEMYNKTHWTSQAQVNPDGLLGTLGKFKDPCKAL